MACDAVRDAWGEETAVVHTRRVKRDLIYQDCGPAKKMKCNPAERTSKQASTTNAESYAVDLDDAENLGTAGQGQGRRTTQEVIAALP